MASRFTNESLRTFIQTSKGKSYAVGAVTILLVVVMFIFGVYPAVGAIIAQVNDNASREDVLSQIEEKRDTLRSLVLTEQSNHAVSLSLETNMPSSLDQETLYNRLVDLAAKSNVSVVSTNFSTIERRRQLNVVFSTTEALQGGLLTLTVEGERDDLEVCLEELENYRRIFNVRGLSMEKLDTSKVSSPFKLILQLEVYYWDSEAAL